MTFEEFAADRLPGVLRFAAPVGGRHDLPADAGVPAHVQWTAERHRLHLPPANAPEPGETAARNPSGLRLRQRQLGGLVRPVTEDENRISHFRDSKAPGGRTAQVARPLAGVPGSPDLCHELAVVFFGQVVSASSIVGKMVRKYRARSSRAEGR